MIQDKRVPTHRLDSLDPSSSLYQISVLGFYNIALGKLPRRRKNPSFNHPFRPHARLPRPLLKMNHCPKWQQRWLLHIERGHRKSSSPRCGVLKGKGPVGVRQPRLKQEAPTVILQALHHVLDAPILLRVVAPRGGAMD